MIISRLVWTPECHTILILNVWFNGRENEGFLILPSKKVKQESVIYIDVTKVDSDRQTRPQIDLETKNCRPLRIFAFICRTVTFEFIFGPSLQFVINCWPAVAPCHIFEFGIDIGFLPPLNSVVVSKEQQHPIVGGARQPFLLELSNWTPINGSFVAPCRQAFIWSAQRWKQAVSGYWFKGWICTGTNSKI